MQVPACFMIFLNIQECSVSVLPENLSGHCFHRSTFFLLSACKLFTFLPEGKVLQGGYLYQNGVVFRQKVIGACFGAIFTTPKGVYGPFPPSWSRERVPQ